MMPPTGLTFIVHGLVVLTEKFFDFFGISRLRFKKRMSQRAKTLISLLIIFLVTAYIGWIIVFFIKKGLQDNYANWKVISREVVTVKEKVIEARLSPPESADSVDYFKTEEIKNYYKQLPLAFKK